MTNQTIPHTFDFWKKAEQKFQAITNLEDLLTFEKNFLGKKSPLAEISKNLKNLSIEEKKTVGKEVSEFRTLYAEKVLIQKTKLEKKALDEKLKKDWLDVTKNLPPKKGALHPISKIQREIETIFSSMGFEIADGPEVETEWNNFDALNIPDTHPARDMQDTFWISKETKDSQKNSVLRTQTSDIQIRKMLQHGAPIRLIAPGRVFRNEEIDATHDAQFYQIEGLLVDEDISLAHLKKIFEVMFSEIFGKEIKVRIRPGYFPFVEPGLEVDIWFEIPGKPGKWLEFAGAGMVHPNVLKNCNIDPEKYKGFAFGFGLTRLAMMKYEIDDIRLLSSSKVDFLNQF